MGVEGVSAGRSARRAPGTPPDPLPSGGGAARGSDPAAGHRGSSSPALGLSPLAEPAGGLRGAQTLEGFLRQESEVVAAQVPRLPGRHRPPRSAEVGPVSKETRRPGVAPGGRGGATRISRRGSRARGREGVEEWGRGGGVTGLLGRRRPGSRWGGADGGGRERGEGGARRRWGQARPARGRGAGPRGKVQRAAGAGLHGGGRAGGGGGVRRRRVHPPPPSPGVLQPRALVPAPAGARRSWERGVQVLSCRDGLLIRITQHRLIS